MELSSKRIEIDQKKEFLCKTHEKFYYQEFIKVTFAQNFIS